MANFSDKKVVMFDLDDTLTASKSSMDGEMSDLLCRLLGKKGVVVIGGGDYRQFERQFLKFLDCPSEKIENLLVFPTSGARLYKFIDGAWTKVYEHDFSETEKKKILSAFKRVFEDLDYQHPDETYGDVIEDRNTQITFSALGQDAPLEKKRWWNTEKDIRDKMQKALQGYLPEFEVRIGGMTSIDVTRKGIDKAYGVQETAKRFGVDLEDMVYVGDALYEGGNDEAVKTTGIDTFQVKGPEDTKEFIKSILRE